MRRLAYAEPQTTPAVKGGHEITKMKVELNTADCGENEKKKQKHTVLLPNRFHFLFFCSNFLKLKEDCESQSLHVMSFWLSPLAAAAPPQGRPTTSNLTTT